MGPGLAVGRGGGRGLAVGRGVAAWVGAGRGVGLGPDVHAGVVGRVVEAGDAAGVVAGGKVMSGDGVLETAGDIDASGEGDTVAWGPTVQATARTPQAMNAIALSIGGPTRDLPITIHARTPGRHRPRRIGRIR